MKINDEIKVEINKIGLEKSINNAAVFFKENDFFLLQASYNANQYSYKSNEIGEANRDRTNLKIQNGLYFFLDKQEEGVLRLFLKFIRKELPSSEEGTEAVTKKILFVSASPDDLPSLRKDVEFKKLKTSLDQYDKNNRFELLPPLFATMLVDLLITLNKTKPYLVHFSGHGTDQGLMLVDEDNTWNLLSNEDVDKIFESRSSYIRYVFFNSCNSSSQAKIIAGHKINVIGNKTPVADQTAISFSDIFYKLWFSGSSFEDSFRESKMVFKNNHMESESLEFWPAKSPA